MARRNRAEKREIALDPVYGSRLVSKFINVMMVDGRKGASEKIMYEALEAIAEKTKKGALEVFSEAVDKAKPALEVKARRIGGATYQVPTDVRAERKEALAIRWIIESAHKRSEKEMSKALLGEILDVIAGQGATLKKKTEMHKMAEANKAFAHFKW
jgi:small subunit ribosomal protein S7